MTLPFQPDAESESAIELKLNTGNYLFHPVGQIVYVDLEGLVLGNYRGMVSIGTTSYNASYSNDNIESKIMQDEHIFSGEQQPMLKSDTLVVTRDNYRTVLSDDDLGRLVRFEGVESRFGTAPWGYKNTFPNYFANSVSYDVNSPGWEDIDQWATWATMRMLPGTNADTFFYGSAWFTYDAQAAGTGTNAAPGNYVVRTSGYSQFAMKPIPKDGTEGTVLGIYGIYAKKSDFTGGSEDWAQYQISVSRIEDLGFPPESLLSEEWIRANTPASSLTPPVKNGGDDYEGD